jgi:hypothetical protein
MEYNHNDNEVPDDIVGFLAPNAIERIKHIDNENLYYHVIASIRMRIASRGSRGAQITENDLDEIITYEEESIEAEQALAAQADAEGPSSALAWLHRPGYAAPLADLLRQQPSRPNRWIVGEMPEQSEQSDPALAVEAEQALAAQADAEGPSSALAWLHRPGYAVPLADLLRQQPSRPSWSVVDEMRGPEPEQPPDADIPFTPLPTGDEMRCIYEIYANGNRNVANEYITWLLDQRGRNLLYAREIAAIRHVMNGGRYPEDHAHPANEDEFCYFYNPQMHGETLQDTVRHNHDHIDDWMYVILGPEHQEERPESPRYGPMDHDGPLAHNAPPRRVGPTHRMPHRVAQMCARTASGKCIVSHSSLSKLDISKRSVLSCGHVFKKSGIKKWIKQQGTCPTCRAAAELQPGRSHLPYHVPAHVAAKMRDWRVGRPCSISGRPLTAENSCVTNCGHVFDRPAITAHLQANGNVCPICKTPNCKIQGGSHKKIKTKRISKTMKSRKCRKFRKSRKH